MFDCPLKMRAAAERLRLAAANKRQPLKAAFEAEASRLEQEATVFLANGDATNWNRFAIVT